MCTIFRPCCRSRYRRCNDPGCAAPAFAYSRKGVKTELVTPTADVLGQEPSTHQHGPEILRGVVPLVVVHLFGWAQAEPEGGEFEWPLVQPRGNRDESDPAHLEYAVKFTEGYLGFPKVFEHRDAQHDVERCVVNFGPHLGQRPLYCPNLVVFLEIGGDCHVRNGCGAHFGQDSSDERSLEAAAEVAHVLAHPRRDLSQCFALGQPHAQTVDIRQAPLLAERFRAPARGGAHRFAEVGVDELP